MRIGAAQNRRGASILAVRAARGDAGDRAGEPPPPRRPRHVLLGWRLLEAPLIVQVLAAGAPGPSLGPAEGARRYGLSLAPPAPARLLKQA